MSLARAVSVLVLLASAAPAAAQTVIFEEDFETPIAGRWTASGGWHRARESSKCLSGIAPFPSSKYGMWFGADNGCTFAPLWSGHLETVNTIHLPSNASDAMLTFWSYDDAECDACGWDWRFVYVSDDGGVTWTFLGESGRRWQWYQVGFDLTPWLGQDILLRFEFDVVDNLWNDFLGWVIDDVRVVLDVCATGPTNFCVAAPNSVGPGATTGWTGSTSLQQDDFHLTLTGAPPKQFCHFFYGPTELPPVVLADGFRCVGPGPVSLVRLLPSAQVDANGDLDLKLDVAGSFGGSNWITPGSTWLFQCWYRDPKGPGGNGSNVSDGLRVTFCP